MNGSPNGFGVEIEAGLATIVLHGSGYDLGNIDALAKSVAQLNANDAVHAIILRGVGTRFWPGASSSLLLHMTQVGKEERYEIVRRGQANVRCLLQSSKLIVAYVDGLAAGGGVDLMLACDLVLVTARTRVNLFYGKLGVVPDHGALHLLAEVIGWRHAVRVAESSPTWSAGDLIQLRIADRQVPEQLEAGAWPQILKRELRAPQTMRSALKKSRWRVLEPGLEAHFRDVAEHMSELLGQPEQMALLARVREMQAVQF